MSRDHEGSIPIKRSLIGQVIPDRTSKFIIPAVKNEFMGKLSLRYFGPIVWETMLPVVYKEITTGKI